MQLAWRSNVGALSNLWSSLTPDERASWDLYAAKVPMTDRLGQQHFLSGQQHWLRSNLLVFRLFGNDAICRTAPSQGNLGIPLLLHDIASQNYPDLPIGLDLHTTGRLEPVDVGYGNFVFFSVSRPEPLTHLYRRQPFIYCQYYQFTATLEDLTDFSFVTPFQNTLVEVALWCKVQVLYADGRLTQSNSMRFTAPPTA